MIGVLIYFWATFIIGQPCACGKIGLDHYVRSRGRVLQIKGKPRPTRPEARCAENLADEYRKHGLGVTLARGQYRASICFSRPPEFA
jgi:hypothetical protein